MYCDLAEYLVDTSERDLRTWLLTDYKEGKAFFYFDSKWLKEVFYHNISSESPYGFVKAEGTPSMNIQHHPHQVWCVSRRTLSKLSVVTAHVLQGVYILHIGCSRVFLNAR